MTCPVVTPSDDVVWPVLVLAEACVCTAWNDLPLACRPGRCGIVPGAQVAYDDCCLGQAWVRMINVQVSTIESFPSPADQQSQNCEDWFWAMEMGAGIVRCMPTGTDADPPTALEVRNAAIQIFDDQARIRNAVACCLREAIDAKDWGETSLFIGSLEPVGPDADCHGFEQRFTVGVSVCPC